MYVFVCVVVFMSFHQPFHRINDASKPGTVSSKQGLCQKKKKKKKRKEKKKEMFLKAKTVSSNIKSRIVLLNRKLISK